MLPPGERVVIVGDLHGQFLDLMHIFRSHGLPSASRPYLFMATLSTADTIASRR